MMDQVLWRPPDLARRSLSHVFLTGLAVISLALLIRWLFFNGPLGSDEIVYLDRSLDVANGHWTSADYNGALRYGYNIPSGLLISWFGLNMFTANLWPLLCSLAEVGVVFVFAVRYLGYRAACFAGLLLAWMPLHVAVATRLHADPVVSLFLTLGFVLFYHAEQTASKSFYFLAGVSLGCVYWTKELASVTFFALALYPICFRRTDIRWMYLVFGGAVMLAAHFALMYAIAGDPFHAIKVVVRQMSNSLGASSAQWNEPWYYYFRYLFFEIKHTWLSPWIAILATFVFFEKTRGRQEREVIRYILFWLMALLLVLSFFPVSLSPLRFAQKQSNYITLFLAPLALAAGWVLAALPRIPAYVLAFGTLMGSVLLSGLEQQAYQVFSANSKALLAFMKDYPESEAYGSVNNGRIACFYRILAGESCDGGNIHDFSELPNGVSGNSASPVFAVLDRETHGWGIKDVTLHEPPACWREMKTLVPAEIGNSRYVLQALIAAAQMLPPRLGEKIRLKFQEIETPKPATVYQVDRMNFWCAAEMPTMKPPS